MHTVQRESGLHVPASLATAADSGKPKGGPTVCYDPDGRRRIVISDTERRLFDRLLKAWLVTGQAIIMVCRNDTLRPDGKQACGQPMMREDWDGPDKGYGCLCTRVHLG